MKIIKLAQYGLWLAIGSTLVFAGCAKPFQVAEGTDRGQTSAQELQKAKPSPTPSRLEDLGDYLHYVEIDPAPESEEIRNSIQEEESIDTTAANNLFIPVPSANKGGNKSQPKKPGANQDPSAGPAVNLPPERDTVPTPNIQQPEKKSQSKVDPKSDVKIEPKPVKKPEGQPNSNPTEKDPTKDPKADTTTSPHEPQQIAPEQNPKVEQKIEPQTDTPPVVEDPAPADRGTKVKNQAIDYHARGRLQNASSIVDLRNSLGDDSPFEVLNRTVTEKRFYATDDLVNFIYFISQFLKSSFSEKKVLVADLSVQKGGPICCKRDQQNRILYRNGSPVYSHASHQNGLDADIAYISKGESRFISLRDDSMVKTLDFDAQKKVFIQAMKSDQVEFILVYPDLKKALCGDAYKAGVFSDPEGNSEAINMLTHLVPDAGHHDHFHVRLKCDPLIHPLCRIHLGEEPTKHGCVFKKSTNK